jgi:hypothetical protein
MCFMHWNTHFSTTFWRAFKCRASSRWQEQTIHQKNKKGLCKICKRMTKMLQLDQYLTFSLSAWQIQTNKKLFTISNWYWVSQCDSKLTYKYNKRSEYLSLFRCDKNVAFKTLSRFNLAEKLGKKEHPLHWIGTRLLLVDWKSSK